MRNAIRIACTLALAAVLGSARAEGTGQLGSPPQQDVVGEARPDGAGTREALATKDRSGQAQAAAAAVETSPDGREIRAGYRQPKDGEGEPK